MNSTRHFNKIKVQKGLFEIKELRKDDIEIFKRITLSKKLKYIQNMTSGNLTIDFGEHDIKYHLNHKLKDKILMRDGYKCIFCYSKDKLHIHHIIPRSINAYLKEKEANLITVCRSCHKGLHFYFDTTMAYIKKYEKEYRNSELDYYFRLILETENVKEETINEFK
ncbi:MAG: HNH endonuclease, partial [Nanoarchaeota archaeon]